MYILRLFFIRTEDGVSFNSENLTPKSVQLNYSLAEGNSNISDCKYP